MEKRTCARLVRKGEQLAAFYAERRQREHPGVVQAGLTRIELGETTREGLEREKRALWDTLTDEEKVFVRGDPVFAKLISDCIECFGVKRVEVFQ